MTQPDRNDLVDPHAREKAIPPLPGCFPPQPRRKGCFDKPGIPDLGTLGSIILHGIGGPAPRRIDPR